MKLSFRISFLFGLIILVTAAGISGMSVLISTRTLDITIMNAIQAENKANAAYVSAKLEGEENVLYEIANRASTRSMDFDAVRPILAADVTRIGATEMAMVFPNGDAYSVLGDSKLNVVDRDYFKNAMAGKNAIQAVVSRLDNVPLAMFASPIFESSAAGAPVVGVLYARKEGAKTLSDMVNNLPSSMQSGFSYLTDNTGTIIAHREAQAVLDQFNPIKAAQTDPSYKSLGEATQKALQERNGRASYTVDGKEMIGYYSEIPDLAWILFTSVEKEDIDRYSRPMYTVVPGIGAGFLIIGLVLAALFGSAIARPIRRIAEALKGISEGSGDLTKVIAHQSSDETGDLAKYFNQTQENIRQLIVTIKNEVIGLSKTGTDLAANMDESAAAMNEITANIQNIKGSIMNQSQRIGETGATMANLVGNIQKLDEHIENQSTHFAQASTSIEAMVSNISSVTQTLMKNEENVKNLTEASEVGRTGLQEVATDIQEIARESEGLLEINAVMESIASQTNLLSMNAAIEAAHAGESGKGFAVVADEIRKLAESSSEQSKTIVTVLKKIKESIDKITRSTENVLNKFSAIDTSVRIVAQQEGNIRTAMEEQGTGSKQILEGVENLKGITKQVAGDSREMLNDAKNVVQGGDNLGKSTHEVTTGMNEMASGAQQVNVAINQVNEMSHKNREGIDTLMREVSRFKVE